ncbi:MAG: amidohydrolase family protein [Acidocella sp.]|uniref:amidohydrolase family protein n=1 Tax=Acidocella sp. TaxID=50710 RepID=UPI003FC0789E
MPRTIIDIRNRPAFLHDFYGGRSGTPGYETAKWLNGRTGSHNPEHFAASQDEATWVAEIRAAGISTAVVIGRDTPAIQNDNDEIATLAGRHEVLVGIGSVDPHRLGAARAVAEAERAVKTLGLKGINLEPGFGASPRHFDDPLLLPVYEALEDWNAPVFLMTGPTTPDLAYNNPDAIGRVARAFPRLRIAVHHGTWPRAAEIIGVAFRYPNVTLVPDMYIFQPGGALYVEAANGALADQIAFGSSFPFRAMAQSVEDYAKLGFKDEVLEKLFHTNAKALLGL